MTYVSLESWLNWRNYVHFMFHAEEDFMSAKLTYSCSLIWGDSAYGLSSHSDTALLPALALSSVQMLLPKSKEEHLLRGRARKRERDCLSAFSHVLRIPAELSKHFLFHRISAVKPSSPTSAVAWSLPSVFVLYFCALIVLSWLVLHSIF